MRFNYNTAFYIFWIPGYLNVDTSRPTKSLGPALRLCTAAKTCPVHKGSSGLRLLRFRAAGTQGTLAPSDDAAFGMMQKMAGLPGVKHEAINKDPS